MLHTARTTAALAFALLIMPLLLHAADRKVAQAVGSLVAEDAKTSDAKTDDSKKDDKQKDDSKKDDKSSSAKSDSKADDSKKSDAKKDDVKKDDKTDAKSADAKSKEESKPPTTYTVKKGPFKVELSLDGTFESKRNTEVSLSPETWADFSVETAVDQGTKVKAGDTLIQFDAKKIDEQIKDQEAGRKLADLALDQLASEIRIAEQAMPLDLKAAERTNRLAEADLNQFLTQDRDLSQKEAEFTVKMYGNYLDYAKEELKQLEKMYKADDLTEDTEEIILKRTRDQVEQMTFYNDLAKIMRDRTMKIELPRREEMLKDYVSRAALALQKARTTLPTSLDKQRLELERQKFDRSKAADKLSKLQHDRELMKISAPADGVVYYGNWTRGQWSGGSTVAARLRKGGRVSPDEVIMTIVDPDSLFVRATVPEKDLWQLKRGLTGTVTPTADGEERLPASLDEFNTTPNAEGKYTVTLLADMARLPKDYPDPAPGMNCKVKLTAYSSDTALTLPAKALQTDKQNEEQNYVWLPDQRGIGAPDDKPVRKNVKVGRRATDTVEILEGLSAGDKVLREAPKDDE